MGMLRRGRVEGPYGVGGAGGLACASVRLLRIMGGCPSMGLCWKVGCYTHVRWFFVVTLLAVGLLRCYVAVKKSLHCRLEELQDDNEA